MEEFVKPLGLTAMSLRLNYREVLRLISPVSGSIIPMDSRRNESALYRILNRLIKVRSEMKGYLPKKNLIFFNPGKKGIVFTHPANQFITVTQLLNVQEHFVDTTSNPVIYIEDRRFKSRSAGL